MRSLFTMLVAVALGSGAALAQYGTPVIPAGVTPTTVASANPTMMPQPAYAVPVTSGAVSCPASATLPGPCAAMATRGIYGNTVILVLGSEERYALTNLPTRQRLNWRDVPSDYRSQFDLGNPMTYHYPNHSVIRHGNPYAPYFGIPTRLRPERVAGLEEEYISLPATLTPEATNTLVAVADRYRTLTPQQAMAMGYMPLSACIPGVGQMYINQAAVDNVFDPMMPEAFAFDSKGRILSVTYIVQSTQPVIAFGQPLQPSPLVPGAQQLTAWLFKSNRNGVFAAVDPSNSYCPRTRTASASTSTYSTATLGY